MSDEFDDTATRRRRIPRPLPLSRGKNGALRREWLRITGISVEGVEAWLEQVHPDDAASVRAEWRRAEITGWFRSEYRVRKRGGGYVRVRSWERRRTTAGGGSEYVAGVEAVAPDSPHVCLAQCCYCGEE